VETLEAARQELLHRLESDNKQAWRITPAEGGLFGFAGLREKPRAEQRQNPLRPARESARNRRAQGQPQCLEAWQPNRRSRGRAQDRPGIAEAVQGIP